MESLFSKHLLLFILFKNRIFSSVCAKKQVTLVGAIRLTLDSIQFNHHLPLLSGFCLKK